MFEVNDRITDIIAIAEDKNYVTYLNKDENEIVSRSGSNFKKLNISLPISAAVTA